MNYNIFSTLLPLVSVVKGSATFTFAGAHDSLHLVGRVLLESDIVVDPNEGSDGNPERRDRLPQVFGPLPAHGDATDDVDHEPQGSCQQGQESNIS